MTRRSMTGFGRGKAGTNGRDWVVEIRSVNHRYLDIKTKLPKGYSVLESKIKKQVQLYHERGRIDIFLSVSGDFSNLTRVDLNEGLARQYKNKLIQLAQKIDIPAQIDLDLLATFPDVISREREEEDFDTVWPLVRSALDEALAECEIMRKQEGEALANDLQERIIVFEKTIQAIENILPELVVKRQETLNERLTRLLDNNQFDAMRLAQEVAILADKADVTEELVRLKSHIQQFYIFIDESGGIGRKLDFLIQEFLREVNTIASKINDAQVAHMTVDLKSELEKMREQVQNIE